MTPVSPQSYDTKLPVGTTIRILPGYLSSCSLECMAPRPSMGGKQKRTLGGALARMAAC